MIKTNGLKKILLGAIAVFVGLTPVWMPLSVGESYAMGTDSVYCNTATLKDPYMKDLAYSGDGTEKNPKRFELTVQETHWEIVSKGPAEKNAMMRAWSYNGQLPGPTIRIVEGDWIEVKVTNKLPKKPSPHIIGAYTTDTAVHFHGVHAPYKMDGVPPLTQPFIKSGESFTYSFQVKVKTGVFMYHSHVDTEVQVGRGLYGTFIVEPKKQDAKPCDREYLMVISDGEGTFLLNGKAFPSTALGDNPSNLMKVKQGERILVRFIDITASETFHTMHPHGHSMKVVAKDGHPYDGPRMDTLFLASGERYDVVMIADADRADGKALWPFHCHILPHLTNPDKKTEYLNMGGMVTLIAYE